MRDLSSLTRDRTCAPAVAAQSPNHWTAREFPESIVFRQHLGLADTNDPRDKGKIFLASDLIINQFYPYFSQNMSHV